MDKKEEKNKKVKSKPAKKQRIKNARLFMFWIDVAVVLLLAFGVYMGIRYFMNSKFLSAYEAGNYETETEEKLKKLNIIEPYLPYYNLGNVAYKEGDYNRAISYYKQALEKNPPKYKECPIRINLALAMIAKIDFQDLSTEKKLQNAIQTLRAARVVLTSHGCAGPVEDDGHSEEAEQLKKDIDKLLEQLENPPDQDENQDQDQNQDQNQDQKETEQERKLREQLEEQQREALQERAETQQQQQDATGQDQQEGGGSGWEYDGKTW